GRVNMSSSRLRLVLAASAFIAWIAWLAYQAFSANWPAVFDKPVILSQPQLLVSTLDIIADVTADDSRPENEVKVVEVFWPPRARPQLADRSLIVTNLSQVTRAEGWTGPGRYILPLIADGPNYQVAAIPRAPGFDRSGGYPIYRDTPQTRHQLEEIHKPTAD